MAMSPGRIYPGENLRIDILFSDDLGSLTDPTAVAFKTFDPCGTTTTYTYTATSTDLRRIAAGEYVIDFTPTVAGRWRYRWEATGLSLPFAREGGFTVQDSPFYSTSDYGYQL